LLCQDVGTLEASADVHQTSDLELLWVLVNHLPPQGVDERVWVEEDRSIRETNLALSH
jgi:hypothetical protein